MHIQSPGRARPSGPPRLQAEPPDGESGCPGTTPGTTTGKAICKLSWSCHRLSGTTSMRRGHHNPPAGKSGGGHTVQLCKDVAEKPRKEQPADLTRSKKRPTSALGTKRGPSRSWASWGQQGDGSWAPKISGCKSVPFTSAVQSSAAEASPHLRCSANGPGQGKQKLHLLLGIDPGLVPAPYDRPQGIAGTLCEKR